MLLVRSIRNMSCCARGRAVVLPGPGSSMYLEERDVQHATREDVVVKVSACGVCHRDVLDFKGAFPFMNTPTVLGHEVCGVVESIGPDVKGLEVGDRVVSLHWAACGSCLGCASGDTTRCQNPRDFLALTADGGYATHVTSSFRGWVRHVEWLVNGLTTPCMHSLNPLPAPRAHRQAPVRYHRVVRTRGRQLRPPQ